MLSWCLDDILLKYDLEEVHPILTEIVNRSITEGVVPEDMKDSSEIWLRSWVFENYRPISNMSFISKSIQRVVAAPSTCTCFNPWIIIKRDNYLVWCRNHAKTKFWYASCNFDILHLIMLKVNIRDNSTFCVLT